MASSAAVVRQFHFSLLLPSSRASGRTHYRTVISDYLRGTHRLPSRWQFQGERLPTRNAPWVQTMRTRFVGRHHLPQQTIQSESLVIFRLHILVRILQARKGSICVANHTSPIDGMILSCDNTYVLIGQLRRGFSGFVQVGEIFGRVL